MCENLLVLKDISVKSISLKIIPRDKKPYFLEKKVE